MQSISKNDIARDIKQGIEEGRYRNCVHLSIYAGSAEFVTQCKMSAFDNAGAFAFTGSRARCPSDCHFFEDKAEAVRQEMEAILQTGRERRRSEKKERWERCRAYVIGPFKWFSSLPWQTQFAIIFLLILIFARPWIPVLLEFVKAMK